MARSKIQKSKNDASRIYWGAAEEESVALYLLLIGEDPIRADKIFGDVIYPKLRILVENIIHKFDLILESESLEDQINDCISHIASKFDKFKPEKGKKSYSYYGTVAKNFLLLRKIRYDSKKYTFEELGDENIDEVDKIKNTAINNEETMYDNLFIFLAMSAQLRDYFYANPTLYDENVYKVLECILYIFDNSKFFNISTKNSFYFICKEMTGLKTKDITKSMIVIKSVYLKIKSNIFDESDIY